MAYRLLGEGFIRAVVRLLAAPRHGSNRSLMRALDGRIMGCDIIQWRIQGDKHTR